MSDMCCQRYWLCFYERPLHTKLIRSPCKSFGSEGNIFPAYDSLDPCFPSVVTRTSRSSLRGKPWKSRGLDQWSRYSRNPWRKIAFISPFFVHCFRLLLFFASLSISIKLIRQRLFFFQCRYADFFVLHVVPNIFWNWKLVGKNNIVGGIWNMKINSFKIKSLFKLNLNCNLCVNHSV